MQAIQPTMAKGIDVSKWQGSIDWPTTGPCIDFGIAKATEGTSTVDSSFKFNYALIKRYVGIRGAYHFAHPSQSDPVTQAQYFYNVVKSVGGFDSLAPMVDVEADEGLSVSALTSWVIQFVNVLKTSTGKQPWLYTNEWFLQSKLDVSAIVAAGIPVHIADYSDTQPADVGALTKWLFLQYSQTGHVPGITGNVDLDVFQGTPADLKAYVNGTSVPTQNVDYTRIVTASTLNIRSGPSTSYPVRYQVSKGQTLHITQVQGNWSYTTYGALGGWCDSQYLAEPPQPPAPPVTYSLIAMDSKAQAAHLGKVTEAQLEKVKDIIKEGK